MKLTGPKFSNLNALLIIGCMESIWAPMIPYIKQAFDLDEAQLGLMLLCTGIGSIAIIPFAGAICKHFGPKRLVYVFTVLIAIILSLISLNIHPYLTAFLLVLFGISLGIIDVSANVNAISLEKRFKQPLMSGFHGGYSVGTLIGAASMSFLLSINIHLIIATIFLVSLFGIYTLINCKQLLTKEELIDNEVESDKVKKSRFTNIPPLVFIVGILCFIMYTSEGAVMSWSSVYVNQDLGVDIRYSGYVYTAFAITMTCMRLFMGNTLVRKIGSKSIVVLGATLVSIGFLLVGFIPQLFACIIGFALIGLGAANIVPQLISFAGTIKGIPVPNTISLVNIIGYSGMLIGPSSIGFSAKNFGLSTTFAIIGGICCLVIIMGYNLPFASKSEQSDDKKNEEI